MVRGASVLVATLTIPDTYTDACQSCGPGDPPPSLAIGYPREVPEGIETDHQCGLCGRAWSTLWRDGWPVERLAAPVAETRGKAA